MSYVELGNPLSSALISQVARTTPKATSSIEKAKVLFQSAEVKKLLAYNPATLRYNKGSSFNFSKDASSFLQSLSFRDIPETKKQNKINKKLNKLKRTLNKTKLSRNREFQKALNTLPLSAEQKKEISEKPGDTFALMMMTTSKASLVEFIRRVRDKVKARRPSNKYYIKAEGKTRVVTVNPSENQDIFSLFLQLTCVGSSHYVETIAESFAFSAEKGTEGILNSAEELLKFGADVANDVSKGLSKAADNTAKALEEGFEKASEAAADTAEAVQEFVEESVEAVADFGEDVLSFIGLGEVVTITLIVGLALVSLLLQFTVITIMVLVFGDFFKGFFWKAAFSEDLPEAYLTDEATKAALRETIKTTSGGAVGIGLLTIGGGAAAGLVGKQTKEVAAVQNGTAGTFTAASEGPTPPQREEQKLLVPGLALTGVVAYLLLSKRGKK